MIEAIAPHANRIVFLAFYMHLPDIAQAVLSRLTFQFIKLISFKFIMRDNETRPPHFDLSRDQFPALRKINLAHVDLLWLPSAFRSLVSLYLIELRDISPSERPSLLSFLEILQECPDLENLCISGVFKTPESTTTPHLRLSVSFSKFNSLMMFADRTAEAACLLSHLSIPARTIIMIIIPGVLSLMTRLCHI
ncbi:hypothetical protein A0H81_06799 [Grifola frondosa]|uniref:F-box domain-containing protein n=1 Tax=Grifola frondosa TaxID=5627 RepID=A0A1C7M948_GRIFR|nr:hypothetical protein A0H81_06799 [Grifola frondosa]